MPTYTYTTLLPAHPVPPWLADDTTAAGINNAGQIVGYYGVQTGIGGGTGLYGFVDSLGTQTTVGAGYVEGTRLIGINDSGQYIGLYSDFSGLPHSFVGSLTGGVGPEVDDPLSVSHFYRGTWPGAFSTYLNGINDAGDVVGSYYNDTGTYGFLHTGTDYTTGYTTLDPFGTGNATATGINNAGEIVGYYTDKNGTHGFLHVGADYTTGYTTLDNGTSTTLIGINNRGQIIGSSSGGQFLYSNGVFSSLDGVPGTVTGINDLGQIVGYYIDSSGEHGFLATPLDQAPVISSISAAPESGEFGPGGTVTLTVTFDKPVTVAGGTPTLALNDGGTAFYTSGSGSSALVFTYTVGAFGSDQNTSDLTLAASNALNLNGAAIRDGLETAADLNGANGVNPDGILKIDTTDPIVTSVVATAAGGSTDVRAGTLVTITITLDEGVKVKGAPTLTLNDGGTANYKSTASNPAAGTLVFTYRVKTGQNIPNLEIASVNLPTGASIKDVAGHVADFPNALTTLTGLQIDTTAPTVNRVSAIPSTGSLGVGDHVAITVTMGEAVTVIGTPALILNDGGTATYDATNSNPRAGSLVFDYTVGVGQNTSDLQISKIKLPAGTTIADLAGNRAADASLVGASGADLGLAVSTNAFKLHFDYSQSLGANGKIGVGTITWTLSQNGQVLYSGSGAATSDDAFPLPSGTNIHIQVRATPYDNHLAFILQDFFPNTSSQVGVLLHIGTPTGGTNGTSEISSDSQGCLIVSGTNLLNQLQADLTKLAIKGGTPDVKGNLANLASWMSQNVTSELTSSDGLPQPTLNVSESPSSGGLYDPTATFEFNISRPIEKEVKVLYSVQDTVTGQTTVREAFIDPGQSGSGKSSIQSLFSKWSAPTKWNDGAPDSSITSPATINGLTQKNYQADYGVALADKPGDSYQISIDGYEVLYASTKSNPKNDIWYLDSTVVGQANQFDLSNEQIMFGNPSTASFVLQSAGAGVSQLVQAIASFGASPNGLSPLIEGQDNGSPLQSLAIATQHHG